MGKKIRKMFLYFGVAIILLDVLYLIGEAFRGLISPIGIFINPGLWLGLILVRIGGAEIKYATLSPFWRVLYVIYCTMGIITMLSVLFLIFPLIF